MCRRWRRSQQGRCLDLIDFPRDSVVEFEYHGDLHYSWPACVLVARTFTDRARQAEDPPEQEIARILACIQLAHVFVGTCDAFERLFLGEIDQQVDGYVRRRPGGRSPQELNRLRTLALAVVNLTNFTLVTEAKDDQDYFTRFAETLSWIRNMS
jgi:hypothetical protein